MVPIDFERPVDPTPVREYAQAGGRVIHTMDYQRLIPSRLRVDEDSLIRALPLVEYYTWLNDDAALREARGDTNWVGENGEDIRNSEITAWVEQFGVPIFFNRYTGIAEVSKP